MPSPPRHPSARLSSPVRDGATGWSRWRRRPPTLTARVVKALLLAFGLAFAVLMVRELWSYASDRAAKVPQVGAVQDVLALLPEDATLARARLEGIEAFTQATRQRNVLASLDAKPVQWELRSAVDGRLVYASEVLRKSPVPETAAATADIVIDGQLYGMAQGARGAWRLRLFEPELPHGKVLAFIAGDLGLSMLIVFPFALLPLWLAVRQGLSPLRRLTDWVRQRPADDFSPMPLDLRYAELQPIERSFNQLLSQSREALGREREFVHDAAHELRTPLAVIATQAHALASLDSEDARRQALVQLERAMARASHQVHQLLTLARMEGPAARRAEEVDCVELARQILIDAAPRAKLLNVELILESPDRLCLRLDQVAFHSALENLVVNALAHAKGATRVLVTLQGAGERFTVTVADDGRGVAPPERMQLFERFHRGRQADVPGSGLGLSIVRESARVMGGDVRCVDGLDGRGLCFEMALRPAARP